MTDEVWRRPEIESPCVKICVVHPEAGICVGCHRTTDEIARWSRMTPEERRAIMAELPGRGARLTRRAGGRAGRLARRRAPGESGGR
jgi:predicted Fe-S protein YdhL (DUF1289 family)